MTMLATSTQRVVNPHFCLQTYNLPQCAHMVSINHPPQPFQADVPWALSGSRSYQGVLIQGYLQ
jgi:hypothetical protein